VHHHLKLNNFSSIYKYYYRQHALLFKQRDGFVGPFTKFFELLRLRKVLLTLKWRGDRHLAEILTAIIADVRAEKWGRGAWPR